MKNNFKLALIITFLVLPFSCKQDYSSNKPLKVKTRQENQVGEIIKRLINPQSPQVIVVSHRGDWRNAPENSVQAIKNCIKMGVDMVEIDVRKTKDNHLIVMHDVKLDRTTTGSGFVKDWTLDSIKTLYLRNGVNHPTHHRIPTLEEALLVAKGKILVNLDKCYGYFNQAYDIMKKTKTTDQVVIKAFNKTYQEVRNEIGAKLDSVIFMPVINIDKQKNAWKIIEKYQRESNLVAFEICFSKDTSKVLQQFKEIRQKGSRVWVNTLWESLNAGYEDDMAVINADSIYGWHINHGVNIIQTDRPQLLLSYLREKGLHD